MMRPGTGPSFWDVTIRSAAAAVKLYFEPLLWLSTGRRGDGRAWDFGIFLRVAAGFTMLTFVLLLAVVPNEGLSIGLGSSRTDSPWESAANRLASAFTGPIARGLSLVAIVVGGLMLAFGEGVKSKSLAGIVFAVGMVIAASNFMVWLISL